MRLSLPAVLSLNSGYLDTSGYLALKGLFTAHVTGNFVTLGASLVNGTSGALAKLLALPVFCAVVVVTRIVAFHLKARGWQILRTMLTLQAVLLSGAAVLAVTLGPFDDADAWAALSVGMTLVAAMAIQNAAHRIHFTSSPPLTLMTGTTTQIMIDLADLLVGRHPELTATAQTRMKRMAGAVLVFAVGCGAGALMYVWSGKWCFCVPALIGLATLLMRTELLQAEPHA